MSLAANTSDESRVNNPQQTTSPPTSTSEHGSTAAHRMSYQPLEVDEANSLEFKWTESAQPAHGGETAAPGGTSRSGYLRSDQTPQGNAGFWTIEYYQQYFDVDTKTVLSRCYHTLLPREDYINVTLESRPDLYGPFWTLTTVIFALFVFSSLAHSLSSYLSDKPYDYDFKLLSVAVGVVYAYGIGVPVGLWGILRWLGVNEWGLLDSVALWGYGMTVWIPVSLLCIAPIPMLRWSLVGAASLLSGFFLLRNVYPVLASAEAKSARLLVIVIAALHLAVALTFKVLFFSYYIVKEVGTPDPIPAA
ncbi:hypothetical protein BOTBODRAFT_171259 [Botryobasidium botryosum FD-172 SS1]|uniref:Protein YIP n=1 Tax=Botryobasidium botryosum (strain FD-172 SS1) TaxID=930990 RepID=A0A067MS46_BOTB1|nr:hypothetical protein BOTBODRAFT_171259 [Botryobasidium botryosum FD-172 SS1]